MNYEVGSFPLSIYLMMGTLTGLLGNRLLLMSRSKTPSKKVRSKNEEGGKKNFHGVDSLTSQSFREHIVKALHRSVRNTDQYIKLYCNSILTLFHILPVIRIIGAGYWRKGRRLYEKENRIES